MSFLWIQSKLVLKYATGISPIIYTSEIFTVLEKKMSSFFFQGPIKPVRGVFQLQPFSYGEGIELDPLPPKELRWCSFGFHLTEALYIVLLGCDQLNMHYLIIYRYTSSVRYDSDRHYIQDVCLQPTGLGLELCSQTIIAVSESTWRRYKTQLEFKPRQRVQCYRSTTIVYPKHTRTMYTTQLNYDGRKLAKRFLSSVELEVSDCMANQCWKKSVFFTFVFFFFLKNANKLCSS